MSQNKFRVCHITNLTQMGGVEKMLMDFLATHKTKDSKFEHRVASTSASTNVVKEFNKAGIEVFIPKRKFRFDPFAIWDLAKWFRKEKIKIVHTYNNVSNTWGILAALLADVDIKISSEHGTAWDTKGLRFELEKRFIKLADINLANSNASKEILKSKYKINEDKIQIVNNGVDFSSFQEKINLTRDEFEISEEEILLGTVGRIDYPKYHHLIIDLACLAKEKQMNFKFIIVGDGPLLNELKNKAYKLQVEEMIIFTGWRNDSRDIINLFDIYLSTSYRESFGNSLVEAAFLKKPIIAPNIDGITDIFKDEKEAILIEPTKSSNYSNIPTKKLPKFSYRNGSLRTVKLLDAEIVFEKILLLINNKDLKNRLRSGCHLKVTSEFQIESYTAKLESIYGSLII